MNFNTFFLLAGPEEVQKHQTSIAPSAAVVWLLQFDTLDEMVLLKCYQHLMFRPGIRFSLALTDWQLNNSSYSALLTRFTFLPGFYKHYGNMTVFRITESEGDKKGRSELIEYMTAQGFLNTRTITIAKSLLERSTKSQAIILLHEYVLEAVSAQQLYKRANHYMAGILLLWQRTEEVHARISQVNAASIKSLEGNKELKFLFERMTHLEKEVQHLKGEVAFYKNNYHNQEKYLDTIRRSDETVKILDFYHAEYEVLPLWYKRFGHVIKVLTGKRTLKSLFNNGKSRD
jgi:hypothetical protein